ncbi:MAG: FG-GAP-like repeat-containing protein [Rhodothermales bacterium]|nr:FG-GAP-like repeat-containing protein [Rhodothermales bacterium]
MLPRLLILLLFVPLPALGQGLRITAVTPAAHSTSSPPGTEITAVFDGPVEVASLGGPALLVFGQWTGVMPGEVVLEDGGTRLRFIPARPFSAGEQVTVSLARTVAGTDGAALGRGYAWRFRTRPRAASLDLTETARIPVRRPGEGWIQTYGAYAGDLDADGFLDFLVPNERSDDVRVFMSDHRGGYGPFRAYPLPPGSRPSTNEGADFDRDGHLDFAVGHSTGDHVSVLLGDGTGVLAPRADYPAADGVRGLAVLDLDGDGFPDLATANREGRAGPGTLATGSVTILRNDGDGTFTRTALLDTPAHGETAAVAADANEDGILDLFVGSITDGTVVVLLGDGQGGLAVHQTVPAGGRVWMITAGDVNGDGHVDVATANAFDDHAAVLLGDGQGHLGAPTRYPTGAFPLAIDLGDLDGDGDLDLVTSNFNGADWTLYENDGTGRFVGRRTRAASSAGSCAVLHDRDNDGTLDMTGIDEEDDLLILFTNAAAPVATEVPAEAPTTLLPAFPNPFRGRTTIPFHLERAGPVRLTLYDLRGARLATLVDRTLPAGRHEATWDAAGLPNGVYVYRLEAEGHRAHRAVAVVR